MEGTKYSTVKKKKLHPLERGSVISKVFFCWFPPFLWRGLKREIDEDGIYRIKKSQEAAKYGNKLEIAWKKELKKESPSLTKALIKVFGGELALFALLHIFGEVVKISHPILVYYMLSLFQKEYSSQNRTEIFIYAAATTLCVFLRLIIQHHNLLWITFLGTKIRVAVCSLIYRKSLKLSRSALAETTVGQMVNLLTNDVGKFDMAVQFFHYLWVTPFLTAAVTYLLYIFVGLSGIVGTVFLIAFVPIQMYMAKLISRYRLRTATRTDERVRLMNEIISGIQVIKMYTWEKPFSKLVEIIRRKEIDQIRVSATINALIGSFSIVLIKIAVYVSILSYVVTGNTLSATYTYTVLSFYGALKLSLVTFFSQGLTNFAQAKVSVQRIQRFLLIDEQPKEASIDDPSHYNERKSKTEDVRIRIENMSVSWSESSPEKSLQNIHFNAAPNQLVAVVGPVGGGKTTLLNCILRELAPVEGYVEVKGTISYASQEPWLFGGSVRQNIVFGQEYVPKKYEEVIKVCALQSDFSRFPHGDRTLVGERGVTLSGGQRARINLARAVYKEADIYLLDDPLSAVDTHVGKQLFDECICGYLRDKCVVLVTHQLQYLMTAQCIYLLEDGRIHSSGTYEELETSDNDFTKLLDDSKEVNDINNVPTGTEVEQERKVENEKSPMIHQKEQKASGKINWNVYKSYFKAVGGWCKIIAVLVAFIMGQVFESAADYFLSIWVNLEQWRKQHGNETNLPEHRTINLLSNTSMPPVTSRRISIEFLTYLNSIMTGDTSLIIYSFLIVLTVTVVVSSRIAFSRCCMAASTSLHNSMFNKIVLSSMRFFNRNPSGRILNRFSKDVGLVDENLPITFNDSLSIGCMVIAVAIVIGLLNPWILIPTLIIGVIFYFMRMAYLVSSRNIKRLEAITRSPVYTHLTASIQGLTTIRAFGADQILIKEFDSFQDSHTAAYFMFLSAARGFGFWLDLHCGVYTFLVMISILFIQNDSYGGNVGLSLTQAISLSGLFQFAMRQWSEFENQMTSVERIQEYADLTPESDINTRDPPKSWPDQGSIKFMNVFMRYSEHTPYILKNLIFEIGPREKIGIVGRTGAGKSSLIQALFRLTDMEGSILIDGIDTRSVPLKVLRSKISIIPQEPVLFSGSLRMNLDPFDEYNDEILWDALEQVELKNAINELPEGLGGKIIEGGSNFSVGQRQLLCLARAIVRNNSILVLDEATANVDPQTDALIQRTIRKKFVRCTVLTIAHRLHTIMDSDRVLVMDDGEVVEFDHPLVLLQMKDGVFQKLVKQTGTPMANNLYSIAEESFSRLHQTTSC